MDSDDPVTDHAEPTAVQLTRIEGVLNGIDYKVSDLILFKHKTETRLSSLESAAQTLRDDAKARDDKAVALALALKEADETRRSQESHTWTPFGRAAITLGALVSLLALLSTYARLTG